MDVSSVASIRCGNQESLVTKGRANNSIFSKVRVKMMRAYCITLDGSPVPRLAPDTSVWQESGGNRKTEGFTYGGVPGAEGADGKTGSDRPKKNVSDA